MKKVLFIEDDTSLLRVYTESLKDTEIEAIGVMTGKDGLEKVEAEKPDLIVLDIMLPGGINGFDVLEQLKANATTASIPVIVLTNLDSEEAVAKKIGAIDYKVKSNTTIDEIKELIIKRVHSG